MTHVPMEAALVLASLLFVTGLAGVLARRNIIVVLLSIEIMLNAAGLAFIAAGSCWARPDGQIMFLFILAAAAAEGAVGLALVLRQNHISKTIDIDAASTMKG
jgi:NADH-quinone oxidoreductase subunit K